MTKKKQASNNEIILHADQLMPSGVHELQVLNARAENVAIDKLQTKKNPNEVKYIKFILGTNEFYGIAFKLAKEIILVNSITKLPVLPSFVAGVINHRGLLLAVIDLSTYMKLRQDDGNISKNKFIIIVQSNHLIVGLLVEGIASFDSYDIDMLAPPLSRSNNIQSDYVIGLHNQRTAILNLEMILKDIESNLSIKDLN